MQARLGLAHTARVVLNVVSAVVPYLQCTLHSLSTQIFIFQTAKVLCVRTVRALLRFAYAAGLVSYCCRGCDSTPSAHPPWPVFTQPQIWQTALVEASRNVLPTACKGLDLPSRCMPLLPGQYTSHAPEVHEALLCCQVPGRPAHEKGCLHRLWQWWAVSELRAWIRCPSLGADCSRESWQT